MWRWARRLIAMVFIVIAIPCIAIVSVAIHDWQPLTSIGRGIGKMYVSDQMKYLILVDQLETNPYLDKARTEGGEVFISGDHDQAACSHVQPQRLADALEKVSVGKIRVRVDCSEDQKSFLWVAWGAPEVQAGFLCGGLCGSGNFYTVLGLRGIPIVIRGVGYVN
jgi:hypothetical protein